jgi:hypothetical protein
MADQPREKPEPLSIDSRQLIEGDLRLTVGVGSVNSQ